MDDSDDVTAAAPMAEAANAAAATDAPASDATNEAAQAVTMAQLRVPRFGAQYLEQARQQLFSRHAEYLPYLMHHLDIHPGMTVVDVGCGTGVYTRLMASRLQGEGFALGIDLHPDLVERARQHAAQEGWGSLTEFRVGDALKLPLPDQFADMIFCNSVLWLLPEPTVALKEMRRVLKPGGRVLTAEPDGGLVHSYDPERPRLSELELRFQETFVRGSRELDGHDYDIGRRLPALFIDAGFVRVRAFPRLFVAAGCDLGDNPQRALADRIQEYRQALAAFTSRDPEMLAAREKRASRARAGGMSDEELAEHEHETIAWLTERINDPRRILYDGATYIYGGILCQGLRYDEPN
ncbi:MAG TPA: methyltransferase domain-containing protein [Ktedonobacterales bacterium]